MSSAATELKIVLGPELAGTLMTPDEFAAVDDFDENYRYELIHGVLVVSPLPLAAETGPNEFLGYLLLTDRHDHAQGTALDLTLPEQYVRTEDSLRRADRVIWAGLGRKPHIRKDLPTIAVEFVSRARRDRLRDYVTKRSEYLAVGIAEYWVLDRLQRKLSVFRNGQPDVILEGAGAVYRTPLLPGFELPLDRLWAVAEDLEPDEAE